MRADTHPHQLKPGGFHISNLTSHIMYIALLKIKYVAEIKPTVRIANASYIIIFIAFLVLFSFCSFLFIDKFVHFLYLL